MLLLSVQTFASSYYGPTVANDRLYRIALALQPSPQVDVQQVMVSIYEYNTYAFIDNNMNGLYAGILLYIPTVDEIAQVDIFEAHSLIKEHNKAWQVIHPKLMKTNQSSANVSTKLSSYHANANDQLIIAEPSLKSDNKSVQTDEVSTAVNLKNDNEHTIFTTVAESKPNSEDEVVLSAEIVAESKPNSESKVALDTVTVVESKPVDIDKTLAKLEEHIKTNELKQMQQQLSTMQSQLGQILVELKGQQHVKQDLKASLQSKYALFDSAKLKSGNDGDYYNALAIDADTAYMEWLIAAFMFLATLGLIIANQRDSYVDMGVDLDNIEDDEYDYIGSSDGIPVKLNLAKAYCEMGNEEKAKKTLAEVIEKGNKSQQSEAKDMLAEIAHNENNKP